MIFCQKIILSLESVMKKISFFLHVFGSTFSTSSVFAGVHQRKTMYLRFTCIIKAKVSFKEHLGIQFWKLKLPFFSICTHLSFNTLAVTLNNGQFINLIHTTKTVQLPFFYQLTCYWVIYWFNFLRTTYNLMPKK